MYVKQNTKQSIKNKKTSFKLYQITENVGTSLNNNLFLTKIIQNKQFKTYLS